MATGQVVRRLAAPELRGASGAIIAHVSRTLSPEVGRIRRLETPVIWGIVKTLTERGHRVAARPTRTYDDARGLEWRVTEHETVSGRSLVFMSVSAMRRVSEYPADWWRLSAAELDALSWRR